MIEIVDTVKGAVIPIRAIPRAGRSAIDGSRDGMLLVRLQSAPTDGAANAELLVLLSRALHVPRRDLEITSGEAARTKRVRVAGLGAADLRKRLSPFTAHPIAPSPQPSPPSRGRGGRMGERVRERGGGR